MTEGELRYRQKLGIEPEADKQPLTLVPGELMIAAGLKMMHFDVRQ